MIIIHINLLKIFIIIDLSILLLLELVVGALAPKYNVPEINYKV